MILRIEPLGLQHDRGAFSCGVKDIDDFLVAFNLELEAPAHRIYVAVDAHGLVLGYYALRPATRETKGRHGKLAPRSIELELAMMGVAQDLQGHGVVGVRLLFDAFQKVLEVVKLIGGIEGFWVGPLNERSGKFYDRAGFVQPGYTGRMVISISEIADALNSADEAPAA